MCANVYKLLIYLNCAATSHIFLPPSLSFARRQEGGELAADGISVSHSGPQLPVPDLPLGGAQIHAGPPALHTQEDPHSLQLQHGGTQLLHLQRG